MVTCQSSKLGWEVTLELSADLLSLGRGSVNEWLMTKLIRSLLSNLRLRQKYKLGTPIKVVARYLCHDYI